MSRASNVLVAAVLRPMAVEFARQIGTLVRERLRATVTAPPARRARAVRATVRPAESIEVVDASLGPTLTKLGFTAEQVARATRDGAVQAVRAEPLETQVRVALRVLTAVKSA